jgi:hypothetical protein
MARSRRRQRDHAPRGGETTKGIVLLPLLTNAVDVLDEITTLVKCVNDKVVKTRPGSA